MASLSSISSIHFYILFYNYKAINLKIFFTYKLDFQTTDQENINKYMIYKFNLYIITNNKNFNF